VIRTFRNPHTEAICAGRFQHRLAHDAQRAAQRRLVLLNEAESLEDLKAPGLRLKKLGGDRKGQWAIRVNDQWRICFRWRDGDAYDVEFVDYH
jgi:proteic killer suppression protein